MSQTTVKVQLQQRYDTAANFTSANPTLLSGEIGWESDTKKYKIGDGSTAWTSLAYPAGAGGYTAGNGVSISASNVISASAIALSTIQTAANETAMLALTTQEGDVVVRSDQSKTYMKNNGTAGSMADFTELATPTDAVTSVNGNTGAITADQLAAAIESATDSNTFTDADHTKLNSLSTTTEGTAILSTGESGGTKFLREDGDGSCSWQSATVDISGKADLSGATFTGDVVFTGDAANVTWNKSTDDLIFNDNAKAIFGTSSDGLKLHHDGSDSYIDQTGTGNLMIRGNGTNNIHIRAKTGEASIRCVPDGAVELFFDGGANPKFETTSGGATVTGTLTTTSGINAGSNISMNDDVKVKLGTSDELEIYHDSGGDSYIQEKGSGVLYITGNHVTLQKSDTSENLAKFIEDGACELFFDGTKRAETTNTGFSISGGLTTTGQINAPNAVFTDDGATGAVVSIQGDDAQQWGFHIGNSTYHNSQASGLKSYIQDDGDLELAHYANAEYRNWWISQHDGTTGRYNIYCTTAGDIYLYSAGNVRLQTTTAGVTVTGTVQDTRGNLRSIPQNVQSSTYTLVASDEGGHIRKTGAGAITIPAGVFPASAGAAVTIINDHSADIQLTQGSGCTMNHAVNGTSGNRTLASKGMATLLYINADECYISGAGLS